MTQPPDISLAATKLRPPTLPECLVQRSHLDEMLDAGISPQMRLILASAPAGSGKSTLLASWLAGRPETVAWLQLEQSDADPARFLDVLRRSPRAAIPVRTQSARIPTHRRWRRVRDRHRGQHPAGELRGLRNPVHRDRRCPVDHRGRLNGALAAP